MLFVWGWVCIDPEGVVLWWTAAPKRNLALKTAAHGIQNWKECYRQGYRCVRCTIEDGMKSA